jgi:hypothetical protein
VVAGGRGDNHLLRAAHEVLRGSGLGQKLA